MEGRKEEGKVGGKGDQFRGALLREAPGFLVSKPHVTYVFPLFTDVLPRLSSWGSREQVLSLASPSPLHALPPHMVCTQRAS